MLVDLSEYEEGQEGVTIMAFRKEKSDVVESLQSQLKKAKDISDPPRKKKVMTNLQSLLKYLNEWIEETLNGLWLVTKGQVEYFAIPSEFVDEWGIKAYALWPDIPRLYLEDVFNNMETKHAVFGEKNKMTHQEGTLHKSRNLERVTDISKIEVPFIAYGKNMSPKMTSSKMIVMIPQNLTWQEVMHEFEKREKLAVHGKLSKTMDKIHHPKECNLLLYKKDIPTALEEYAVKELFILRNEIEMIRLASETNCKVWIVDKVETGDITEKFEKDYAGMLGVRYFAV